MSQLINLSNSLGLTASDTWDPLPPYEFGRGRSKFPGVPEASPNLEGGGNIVPNDSTPVTLEATAPTVLRANTRGAVVSYRWSYDPNFSGITITPKAGASAEVTFLTSIVKNTVYTIYCEALDADGDVQWYCQWKFFVSNVSWLFQLLESGLMEYERWESYELYDTETGDLEPFKFMVTNVDANSLITGGYIDASYVTATPVQDAIYSVGKLGQAGESQPPALIKLL